MQEGIQGVGWIVVRGEDPVRLIAFYRDIIGLPVLRSRETSCHFSVGEGIMLQVSGGGTPKPRVTDRTQLSLYWILRVYGLDKMVERLKAHGVEFLIEDFITKDGKGRLVAFFDPENNLVGLQERFPDTARAEDAVAFARWKALTEPE